MFHWTFPSFLFFTLVIFCSCEEQFLVVAPNLIRVDSHENVFLQANGVTGNIQVTIAFKDFSTDADLGQQHYTVLTADNKYHTLTSVKLSSSSLNHDGTENKYVFMEVKFANQQGRLHTEKRAILGSFHSGYIFIQTDKPIYKPGETVLMRAYVSSTTFKASDENLITIDIKNAGGVVHQINNGKPSNGIFSQRYILPEFVTEGKWTITARFDDWPQNNFNTTFEVKKYVLPAFKVTVTPRELYMNVDDPELFVDVTARYLFGESVIGTAYVIYGLRDGHLIRRAPTVKQVYMLEDGGTFNITMKELKEACKVHTSRHESDCTVESLEGSYVYMKLTVLTDSGGDLFEVEESNVKIVKSPFVLALKAIPKYFKPGLPFYFLVDVSYHDGTPATDVPLIVTVQGRSEPSSRRVSVNMPKQASNQKIIISTNKKGLSADKQARKEVTVEPYRPANADQPNYLYIHEIYQKVELTEMSIHMSIDSDRRSSIQEITYLLLSKGKIVEAKRVPVSQLVTSVSISVTAEMMPTFRFVAFYLLQREVVSDSVKLEVANTCVQPPIVSVPNAERTQFRPGAPLNLKIEGEPLAKISLVAVDQALYLLAKNHFNQRHILNEVDSRDFGCTHGSGMNAMGVFSDAGLLFAMKNGPFTNSRQEQNCPNNIRRRRSADMMEHQEQLLGQFQEKLLQRCCQDGLKRPLMPYSCEQHSQYIAEGPECVKAFLKCCNIYKIKVNTRRRHTSDDLDLGRNSGSGSSTDITNPEDFSFRALEALGEDEDISMFELRKPFPETWLWTDVVLPQQASQGLATVSLVRPIPDSITEWSILAVSSSLKTGFCVAEPWTFVVKKKFFVDLKLPYSVARNEQVEIKAVVYNFLDDPLEVRVVLSKTDDLCSVAFTQQHMQTVTVPPMSSRAVPYTIVPLEAKQIPIEVSAYVVNEFNDRIQKVLNVVVEGAQKAEHKILQLNPAATQGKQVFRTIRPNVTGVVPRSQPITKIKVSGNVLTESIQNSIHDDPLANLIRMPGGCVEQNLAAITFPLIASLYLENTNGWETVGVQRKIDADQYIKTGYTNQLNFKLIDGSYPPSQGRGPSTWVTAYVVKVFTMALSLYSRKSHPQNIINIDEICQPVSFLVRQKQSTDGSFVEANPVRDRHMTGGLRGSDSAATLTAFVSIALAEVEEAALHCSFLGVDVKSALARAVPYLKRELLKSPPPRPYTKAITSYALALLTDRSYDPSSTLLAASSDGTFWPDDDPKFSLEATGYALLALLKKGRLTEAEKPFAYLRDHRDIGGGSGNTQSTMVVLQALTEYLVKQPAPERTSLSVTLRIAGRKKYMIFTKTSYQSQSFTLGKNENFDVEAYGNGEGTFEVVTYYNQLPEENIKSCKMFDMQVTVTKSTKEKRHSPEIINVFELSISVKALEDPAIPAIVDITLPTGFTVETEELEKVSNIYPQIVTFKLLQLFNVGLLQPSSVTVYKYYEGDRCTQLYSIPQDQVTLTTICRNHACQCMHDNCCQIKGNTEQIPKKERETFACATLRHVFKVKVLSISEYYNKYEVEITKVIKSGVEKEVVPNERRFFFTDKSCRNMCVLQLNSEYLIMGSELDKWTEDSATNKTMYVLSKDTWVERWPSESECKDPAFEAKCISLTTDTDELIDLGCTSKK